MEVKVLAQLSEDDILEFSIKGKMYERGLVSLEEFQELYRRLAKKYNFDLENTVILYTGKVLDKRTLWSQT